MKVYEDVWKEIDENFSRLGLNENPFSESEDVSSEQKINEVFTGRKNELKEVLSLFQGSSRKRILVYGWWGIGKTTFIKIVHDALKYKFKKSIVSYISLPDKVDIPTASLIALALEMPKDEWALQQLNLMGIMPNQQIYKRKTKAEIGGFGLKGGKEEETIPFTKMQYPSISFDKLCERALKNHDKIVICIDDLDKQDPDRVKLLLRESQGLLKGRAWFILSGHPGGLTKDMKTANMGLFDLTQEIKQMDEETSYQMLINYLNFAKKESSKHRNTIHPFTKDAAKLLFKYTEGHPRWFNRLSSYVLIEALNQKALIIDVDMLEKGRNRAKNELRNQQELTEKDLYLFNLVVEKGMLTDENVSMDELNRFGIQTFNELMPMLEKLVQTDLLRQIPDDDVLGCVVSPIMK